MRSRRAETSVPRISAFPPARADRCVVFPPGAAQASRIRSPGPGRRSVAINCAPSSMTRYAPSRNAASEKTGAGFPRTNPSGANRQGTGSLPSSANRLANASVTTRNGLARTAKGGFSRHAARNARVSASPSDRRECVDQIPRGRPLRGEPAGVSLRGQDGNLPRADDPAQNRVDEPPRAAAPRRLDGRHRFVQRRAVGDAGVEELVRPHPEGVPDVRVGLFEGTGEERQESEIDRSAPAQGSHHELRQEPPVAGIGKGRVAQRAVEHDVGEGLVAVHPGQDRDRRVPYDSRSPVATRRPWAYAHASIAFPPSGCTT